MTLEGMFKGVCLVKSPKCIFKGVVLSMSKVVYPRNYVGGISKWYAQRSISGVICPRFARGMSKEGMFKGI